MNLLARLYLRYDIWHADMWRRALEREGLDSTEVRKYLNAQRCALAQLGA